MRRTATSHRTQLACPCHYGFHLKCMGKKMYFGVRAAAKAMKPS